MFSSINNSIKLQTNCILNVPFDKYDKDFTFIVNGERFETNKIVSDLLSSKIKNIHHIDPTINEYFINTKSSGNFQTILDLLKFERKEIADEELSFVIEILNNLCPEKIEINISTPETNLDNFHKQLQQHERYPQLFKEELEKDIEFVSEHFYEIIDQNSEQENIFLQIETTTLERIINNNKLRLNTEDQLLKFINQLYQMNEKYSNLYEYVYFIGCPKLL